MNTQDSPTPVSAKEIPDAVRPILLTLGRGLGTVSVYGNDHPSVEQIIDLGYNELKNTLLEHKAVAIGTFNGTLTIDEEPVIARDIPIKTLERRMTALKISHLALTRGITRDELKQLLLALSAPSDTQMRETMTQAGLHHIQMADVKYVALREGEEKTTGDKQASGPGTASGAPQVKIDQIIAFLKGETSGGNPADLKKMLSDPERLGQLILEAASIRQSSISTAGGESLADIVVGCLRRTFSGLRQESEFQSSQGRITLAKSMLLLEKSVMDRIHASLGTSHPDLDRRILDAIREMEEEHQLEALTTHYFEQQRKLDKTEKKLIESIRRQGLDASRELADSLNIPEREWQRLMVKAGAGTSAGEAGSGSGPGSGPGGLDFSALALVLEKLDQFMQLDSRDPVQVKSAVQATRTGMNQYADRIETRIQELESQIVLDSNGNLYTIEDHASSLSREDLMLEVSRLTLALLQPLTVVSASVQAALLYADKDPQIDLLGLANDSGKRMEDLTRRLMLLVGYPTINETELS